MTKLSVILPTHNPRPDQLRRTLLALGAQTLPHSEWELVVVDNASSPALSPARLAELTPVGAQVVTESVSGLSVARKRGFATTRGDLLVLVDDDNVLAPDYLDIVRKVFCSRSELGVIGGRITPEYEVAPAAWAREFEPLLACRHLGEGPLISHGLRSSGAARNEYPPFAPVGAGMALRREVATRWMAVARAADLPDRRGTDLSSGGDNDIVFEAMHAGWEVGYFPELRLTHLIPAGRLEPGYLGRLNRGIQKSWMQVLTRHDANPWPPISATGATLRKLKAWWMYHAWSSPAAWIRWQGACGHFEGRIVR